MALHARYRQDRVERCREPDAELTIRSRHRANHPDQRVSIVVVDCEADHGEEVLLLRGEPPTGVHLAGSVHLLLELLCALDVVRAVASPELQRLAELGET